MKEKQNEIVSSKSLEKEIFRQKLASYLRYCEENDIRNCAPLDYKIFWKMGLNIKPPLVQKIPFLLMTTAFQLFFFGVAPAYFFLWLLSSLGLQIIQLDKSILYLLYLYGVMTFFITLDSSFKRWKYKVPDWTEFAPEEG